jgi:hypothetical protein
VLRILTIYGINLTKVTVNRFESCAHLKHLVARIYGPHWDIEKSFGWWTQHLKAYQSIAWSKDDLMVYMHAGLINYRLLSIYCFEQHTS